MWKVYNIHWLPAPADRRPVWASDAFTPARASFNVDAGWWNGQRHNWAVPVWSVTEILYLSLSLSLSYSCIYVLDSQPTVACPPITVAWPFSDFSEKNFKLLETSKKVVWQSADGRVTSDHCRVIVQWLFSKNFKLLETCKNVVWLSADGRMTSDHCRVTVQWIFWKKIYICSERLKNVVWQSADGRVTSDHCRVTVQWLFSKILQIAWNVQKRRLTVGQRSRDLRPLSRDCSETFSKNSPNCLKRLETPFDSRPTVAWPPTNVAWPLSDFFSEKFPNCSKRPKTFFDCRPTVAWPPTTIAWPFSDFFQNFSLSLETSKKCCLTVGRRSRDLRPLPRDRSVTFFKHFPNS